MVDFAGWQMPIQYGGIVAEHKAVRTAAGLFDVSHMGQLRFRGPAAASWLAGLAVSAVDRLAPGRARYTHLCDERARIIDDVIIYQLGHKDLLMVVNAATTTRVRDWCAAHAPAEGVTLEDESLRWACLAVQGPRAAGVVAQVVEPGVAASKPFAVRCYPDLFGGVILARTGYTGEWGVELLCPAGRAVELWATLLEVGGPEGLVPCGLGARDTLRLEKGYLLSGQDFNGDRTPLEAGCGWLVDWDHEFMGREALQAQKGDDYSRLTGIKVTDKGVARPGCPVVHQGRRVGVLTSGGPSVMLKSSIGLAYLPAESRRPGTPVQVVVRGKSLNGQTVKLPFL